ncbi:MAG: hypothetical protein OSJ54_06030 [Oscillospiraceae bacterium]|nr:hypothetical protein [Oscillospiraceae bacterium]
MDLEKKIREYREYTRLIEEATATRDAIADEIKAAMLEAGKDKMVVGEYKLSYTDTTRTSLDRSKLEAKFGDLSEFVNVVKYKRFCVA